MWNFPNQGSNPYPPHQKHRPPGKSQIPLFFTPLRSMAVPSKGLVLALNLSTPEIVHSDGSESGHLSHGHTLFTSSLSHLIASLASSSSLASTAHHCSHSPAHSFFAFGSSNACLPTSDPQPPTAHREAQLLGETSHCLHCCPVCQAFGAPAWPSPCSGQSASICSAAASDHLASQTPTLLLFSAFVASCSLFLEEPGLHQILLPLTVLPTSLPPPAPSPIVK